MSGIASVVSHKFITRMFAAMVSLQMFAPINVVTLTGAFALIGVSRAAAEPFYQGSVGYSRGISGLSIGMGGILGIGPTSNMSYVPSSGARPSGVSSRQSRSVRAIKSTTSARLPPEKNKITNSQFKSRAVIAPKTGSNSAAPQNTSAPNFQPASMTGSRGGSARQAPGFPGGGPVSYQGDSFRDDAASPDVGNAISPRHSSGAARDNASASGDSGGANSSRSGAGAARNKATAPEDGKGLSPDNTSTARDGAGATRDNATASRDTKVRPPVDTITSRDGAATSRDNSTISADKADGGSRDSTFAAKDGATGGTIKAEDIRRAVDRCVQTYVSYDRATMTYVDHSGVKQSCP
jgi:hypothetical protein